MMMGENKKGGKLVPDQGLLEHRDRFLEYGRSVVDSIGRRAGGIYMKRRGIYINQNK